MALSEQRIGPNAEAMVLDTIEQMTRAFEAADIDRVMQAYEDEAVIAFEPGVGVADPASIRRTFQEWFALNPRFDYKGHEVLVAGDLALHVAPWRMRGTAPDGAPIQQQGLSVAVLRRQADGRWLLVIDNPYGQHLLHDRG